METVLEPSKINSPSSIQAQTSGDPISLAKQIGQEALGSIGAKNLEQLEISFICSLLKPIPSFPTFRTRQNLFVYGSKGIYKDLIMQIFFDYCIPKSSKVLDITSCTLETTFGSLTTDGKKLIDPIFLGADFTVITELSGYLQWNRIKEQIGLLNKLGEGNKIVRGLLKFGSADPSLILRPEDIEKGLFFYGNRLEYKPKTTLIVCSHILDPRTINFLNQNAFLDRFKLNQNKLSDKEAKTLFKDILKSFDMKKVSALRAINEDLKTKIPNMETRVPEKYEDLCKTAMDNAERIAEVEEVSFLDVYGSRHGGNILREAIAREMVGSPIENISFNEHLIPETQLLKTEVYDDRQIASKKLVMVRTHLQEMLAKGPMTKKDIFDQLQGQAATQTIYTALHSIAEQVKHGEWALKNSNKG